MSYTGYVSLFRSIGWVNQASYIRNCNMRRKKYFQSPSHLLCEHLVHSSRKCVGLEKAFELVFYWYENEIRKSVLLAPLEAEVYSVRHVVLTSRCHVTNILALSDVYISIPISSCILHKENQILSQAMAFYSIWLKGHFHFLLGFDCASSRVIFFSHKTR